MTAASTAEPGHAPGAGATYQLADARSGRGRVPRLHEGGDAGRGGAGRAALAHTWAAPGHRYFHQPSERRLYRQEGSLQAAQGNAVEKRLPFSVLFKGILLRRAVEYETLNLEWYSILMSLLF